MFLRDVTLNFPVAPEYRLVEFGPKSQTYKLGSSKDPARWGEIFSPDRDCTIRVLQISNVRATGTREPLPPDSLVRVIQQKLNPDYPKITPHGGTGKGIWIR